MAALPDYLRMLATAGVNAAEAASALREAMFQLSSIQLSDTPDVDQGTASIDTAQVEKAVRVIRFRKSRARVVRFQKSIPQKRPPLPPINCKRLQKE